MWNLDKNGLTDTESKIMVTKGEGWGRDKFCEIGTEIYTTIHKKR